MTKHAADSLRHLGDGANLLAALFFGLLSFKLYAMTSGYLAAAGGLPPMSLDGVETLLMSADLKARLTYWAAAWLCAIGTAGTGWMALLGARFTYQWLLRTLAR